MAKVETKNQVHMINEEVVPLFHVLGKPYVLKLLQLIGEGIGHSTYAMKTLGLSQKTYYSRLNSLLDAGLVRKLDGIYVQTALGGIIYNRLLPVISNVCNAKNELELIEGLEKTGLESETRNRILEELGIPDFTDTTHLKLLGDYEALAVEVIDLYDSAEESVLLASNYIDVRVMEACFRSVDRGVTNRLIVNKNSLSSNMQKLKMMLSLTFAKTIVSFASNKVNLREFVRFIDLPYTFCVVDGQRNIIDMSDTLTESFIVALSLNDKVISEKYTKFFERLWKAGETNVPLDLLDSIKSS